jgi:hypothetical protein
MSSSSSSSSAAIDTICAYAECEEYQEDGAFCSAHTLVNKSATQKVRRRRARHYILEALDIFCDDLDATELPSQRRSKRFQFAEALSVLYGRRRVFTPQENNREQQEKEELLQQAENKSSEVADLRSKVKTQKLVIDELQGKLEGIESKEQTQLRRSSKKQAVEKH